MVEGQDEVGVDPVDRARDLVLDRLSHRAHTRAELASALAKKGVDADVSETVLDRMEEVGLVDDAEFARAWTESRQRRRHLSRRALRQELQRKGVDAETVAETVNEVDDDDELAAARDLARRKARSLAGLDPLVRQRRLAGALARRGFGSDIVRTVVGEVEDAEDAADADAADAEGSEGFADFGSSDRSDLP